MASVALAWASTSVVASTNTAPYSLASNVCYNPYTGPNGTGEYYEFQFQAPTTVTKYMITNSTNGGGLQQETWGNGNQFGTNLPNNFLNAVYDLGTGASYSTTSYLASTAGVVHMFGWYYAQRTGNFTFTLNNTQGYANLWVATQSSLLTDSVTSTTVAMTQGQWYYLRILGFGYPNLSVLVQGPGLPINGTTNLAGWVFPGKVNNMYASDAPSSWTITGDSLGYGTYSIALGSVTGNSNLLPGGSYFYTIPSPQPVMRIRFRFTSTVASNVLSVSLMPFTAVGAISTTQGGVYIGPTSMVSGGVTYSGEWIQVQLPTSTAVAEYMFQFPATPVSWALHYSTNGTTWSLADLASNVAASGEVHRLVSATGSYWRLQVIETSPAASVQGSFSLQRFMLMDQYGRSVHSIQPNGNTYTTVSSEPIGDAILGTYSVQSSSGDFTTALGGTSAYYPSSYGPFGNYIGTTVTSNIVNQAPVYGDWVQLSLPSAKQVANLAYRSYDMSATPSNVWVLASNDLVTWNVANISTVLTSHLQNQTFVLNTGSLAYQHWRMVVANTWTNYYSTGSQGYNLSAWYLIGPRGQVLNTSLVSQGAGSGNKLGFVPTLGGVYNGTATTTVTTPAVTFSGEWLQMDLPSAVVSNVLYNNSSFPATIVSVLGATTFGSWTFLSNVSLLPSTYISFPNTSAYRYYRLVFQVAVSTSVYVNQLYFCNGKGQPITQPYTSNSTVASSNSTGTTDVLGQYVFSSSKQGTITSQGGYLVDDAYLAFDGLPSSWVSQRVFNAQTGAGSANVQVEFSVPVVANELVLTRPMFTQFSLLGSSNYVTYTSLIGATTVTQGLQSYTYPVTSPGAYKIYQLNITQSLYGSNVVSIDDIGLYDNQGRINQSGLPGNQFVSTGVQYGGNTSTGNDFILVSFPSTVPINSYSIYSNSMPRSWNVYNGTSANPTNLIHSVTDYQGSSGNFQITNPSSNQYYMISFTATQSSTAVPGLAVSLYNGYFNDDPYSSIISSLNLLYSGFVSDLTNIGTATNNTSLPNGGNYFTTVHYGRFLCNATGSWNWSITSDDASYLWIGPLADSGYNTGNATLNDGGLHGMQTVSTSISMTAGTYYSIRIIYGQNAGGYGFTVSFQPPGFWAITNGVGYYYNNYYQSFTSNVAVSRLAMYTQAGFEVLPTTISGPSYVF